MITLHIRHIFKARGIVNPYAFLVRSGMTYHAAQNLLSRPIRSIRFDHLEFLCKLLVCEPNDLFVWTPDKADVYPPDFPLAKLKFSVTESLSDTMSHMPFDKLKEMTQNILQQQADTEKPQE